MADVDRQGGVGSKGCPVPEARDSASAVSTANAASEGPAAATLRAAYPPGPERERAVDWLSWLAWRMGEHRVLGWWDIPSWVGERKLRWVRALIAASTLGLFFGLVLVWGNPLVALAIGAIMSVLGAVGSLKFVRLGKLRREPVPWAMVPRRPRSAWEFPLLAGAVVTGLPLRWVLRRLWARPVVGPTSATPDRSYRACGRSTAIDLAACALAGGPVLLIPDAVSGRLLLAGTVSAMVYLVALADGKVPAVWQTQLFLLITRRRRIRFHRFLEEAVDRDVLCPVGPWYRFRDLAVQDYLIGLYLAVLEERERRIVTATGARARLVSLMSPKALGRLAVDLGGGAGLGIYAAVVANCPPGDHAVWGTAIPNGLLALGVVFLGGFILLGLAVGGIRWSLGTAGMSSRARVAVLATVVCAAGLSFVLLGPGAVRHGAAVAVGMLTPAVLVAVLGGWACVLVHRRWRAARIWPARHAADALLMMVTGTAILLLLHRDLVSAEAAAAPLFPVAAWLSIRGWRAMNESGRFAVRAAADIAIALMLGGCLVLLLVWLANLLHMPAAEVAVLRGALGRFGALIDLPWWTWAALFLVLAGTSLALAVWPGKFAKPIGWFTRLRVVPSAEVTRRTLTAVHVGLLVIVLIGAAAPTVTAPALRARLAARYTETLSGTLQARGQIAPYQAITREFSQASRLQLTPLADLVLGIDAVSKPSSGQPDATSTELDLARRIGELQARTLALRPQAVTQAEAAVTRQRGFDAPAADAGEENKRLGALDTAEHEEQVTEELADRAADLAATAIAQSLQLPGLGHTEVVQIIREYLSGLIENSALKDVFAAWIGRITGRSEPPPPAELVIPDPGRLKDVANAALNSELASTRVNSAADARQFLNETGITAVVDLTNQVRYLQENSGPCAGCAHPVYPSGWDVPVTDDHEEPDDAF